MALPLSLAPTPMLAPDLSMEGCLIPLSSGWVFHLSILAVQNQWDHAALGGPRWMGTWPPHVPGLVLTQEARLGVATGPLHRREFATVADCVPEQNHPRQTSGTLLQEGSCGPGSWRGLNDIENEQQQQQFYPHKKHIWKAASCLLDYILGFHATICMGYSLSLRYSSPRYQKGSCPQFLHIFAETSPSHEAAPNPLFNTTVWLPSIPALPTPYPVLLFS